ncbi:MAG: SPFH/Band 7/PHB domain protein [Bacteroidota bacterium]|nr:SPFH/Band 7/PHB domain protein [Bacteroidota bacterium]
MAASTIIFLLIALFAVIFAMSGIKIVQQSETIVIERLGRYHRTLQSGINIIWPVIDKPRDIMWRYVVEGANNMKYVHFKAKSRIDLRETVYDFPRQNVITKDNVVTEINALLYYQIMDPIRAIYEISNLPDAIEKLTQTTLRNVIGDMELDETLTSRDVINNKLRLILDDATNKWGVKVNRVELQDVNPPRDIRDAMEKQMRAERDRRARILEAEGMKRAQVLEAEGIKESEIRQAEGERQSRILIAEGEAEGRIRIAEAEASAIEKVALAVSSTNGDPTTYLIAMRYLETFKEMVSGKDNKVIYIPYEASGVLSSLGSLKDMLDKSKSN